mgnify:CR=1 FL=1|tara:strand:+ start:214 stop:468 length:255 start_codon:yes stop_codon:yes gene_type:complete
MWEDIIKKRYTYTNGLRNAVEAEIRDLMSNLSDRAEADAKMMERKFKHSVSLEDAVLLAIADISEEMVGEIIESTGEEDVLSRT